MTFDLSKMPIGSIFFKAKTRHTTGQHYRLIGVTRPVKVNGAAGAPILEWETECAECGQIFLTTSGATRGPETRRCREHRRPGAKIKPAKPAFPWAPVAPIDPVTGDPFPLNHRFFAMDPDQRARELNDRRKLARTIKKRKAAE